MNTPAPQPLARHPALSALVRWSCHQPVLMVSAVSALYFAAFVPLHMAVGIAVGIFAVLLMPMAGFLLPTWGTVVFWILFTGIDSLLFDQFEHFGWDVRIGGSAITLVAALGGRLARRAWDYIQSQRLELKEAHRQVLEAQAVMVQTAKLASLGELAAGVGHEVNQPLQIIRLAVEAIRRPITPVSQGELLDHLDTIIQQTQRAGTIVTHLRTLGRSGDRGRRTPTDLNALIRESTQLFSARWREAGILVHLELDESLPPVLCNAVEIEETLIALYLNATDALADAPQRFIDIRTHTDRSRACVEVHDSGHGIAPKVLDRVFDPFFTTKPVGKGRGLGLSLGNRIAADHGGTLTVTSEPGEGATFRLCLPAAAGAELSASA